MDDYYRISVTILPCGEDPGVKVVVHHLLEEWTMLSSVFTRSQRRVVYLGEMRLFNMVVSINQSLNKDHITLKVLSTVN